MFRMPKTLDPITLFHNPSLASSNRALEILKRASTAASEVSASEPSTPANEALHNAPSQRGEFQLEVTTAPPTTDQLRNILDYLGTGPRTVLPGEVVEGATDSKDAIRRLVAGNGFVRPVTVDWIYGKAVVGDDESEILRMVKQLPAEGSK